MISQFSESKQLLIEMIEEEEDLSKTVKNKLNDVVKTIDDFKNKESDYVRNEAVEVLESVINDPNLPTFMRTQVWQIISILESYEV